MQDFETVDLIGMKSSELQRLQFKIFVSCNYFESVFRRACGYRIYVVSEKRETNKQTGRV